MALVDIGLTADHFAEAAWQDVIANCNEKSCFSYRSAYSVKAEEAKEAGNAEESAVYLFLSRITSFVPKLDSPNEPFTCMMSSENWRTAMPDDLSDGELNLLTTLVVSGEIADPELRARIADILWVRQHDYHRANEAVRAYLASAQVLERTESWHVAIERLERALQLALMTGNRKGVDDILTFVQGLLDSEEPGARPYMVSTLITALVEQRQGDPSRYAHISEKFASYAEQARHWHMAEQFWLLAAKCYERIGDIDTGKETLVRAAETQVCEAEEAESRSYGVAAHFIEHAIEIYRRAGGFKNRIDELHLKLLENQRLSADEMKTISSEPVDVTDTAVKAMDKVKGRSLEDALIQFVLLVQPSSKEKMRELVHRLADAAPLAARLSHVVLDAQGKVVGRRPGMISGNPEAMEAAIRGQMFSHLRLGHAIVTVGVINPALNQINIEHNARIRDFLPFVTNNPFIPPGREWIYAQGLHAGLVGDYITALHLLIPQLENSIRFVLSQVAELTSGLDDEFIQDEFNLNKTLYLESAKPIFGEDLLFDLQGLLVERLGSNYRNRLAHGLLNYDDFYSPEAVYLWWLISRMCITQYIGVKLQLQDNSASHIEDPSAQGAKNEIVIPTHDAGK